MYRIASNKLEEMQSSFRNREMCRTAVVTSSGIDGLAICIESFIRNREIYCVAIVQIQMIQSEQLSLSLAFAFATYV